MIYLYLTSYAASNPELALLGINCLQKDCRDEDPMTRGLALRSFTSLRLDTVTEYLPSVIAAGLKDASRSATRRLQPRERARWERTHVAARACAHLAPVCRVLAARRPVARHPPPPQPTCARRR